MGTYVDKIKISKELEWLRPYLELVAFYHWFDINELEKIAARKPNFKQAQQTKGVITKRVTKRGKKYSITLFTEYLHLRKIKDDYIELQINPYSKIDILCALAHEISHIINWEHTLEHKIKEAFLTSEFMKKLKTKGDYISEEQEMKDMKINKNLCRTKDLGWYHVRGYTMAKKK